MWVENVTEEEAKQMIETIHRNYSTVVFSLESIWYFWQDVTVSHSMFDELFV